MKIGGNDEVDPITDIGRGGTTPLDGRLDLARAVAELADRLPEPLAPLARIAFNYRWSWLHGAADLFRDVDPELWRRSSWNPRYLIESVPPRRFHELARDASYVARLRLIGDRIWRDLTAEPQSAVPADRPIAYFCAEFGLHPSLSLYGGGLGILAGDLVKAASDLGLPTVGVGLLYREGYFHQRLDPDGWQREYWTATDFERLPAVRVTGADQLPLTVELELRGRRVRMDVWRLDVGRVPLFLLDTDREDNHPIDRWITARLYIGDRHTRLAQYAVLGIGGARALDAMGIRPSFVHLNEGHAGLSAFERLRRRVAAGQSYDEALEAVRRETVFTTHTPVAAGNEGYSREEIEPVLAQFLDELGFPRERFYETGQINPGDDHEPVNITLLSLRTSRRANAVSLRHGEVARQMWQPLWPDRQVEDVPITHVTNGVHTTTWMAAPMQALLDRHFGEDWRERESDPELWRGIDAIPDAELWAVRTAQRAALVDYVREHSIRDRLGRGEPIEYVEAAARVFDPGVLTIGFARRVATYKRLYLLTRFPERGSDVLGNPAAPAQLVVAGKAHPADNEAKQTLGHFFELKQTPGAASHVVFLEDYDLRMAPCLVAGVDLWVNLPRPPLEASGTSGMKVTLNGGLNLSVLDGWWVEAYDGENGWAIESPDADPYSQDEHDAQALLGLLEHEVLPLFYQRDAAGLPSAWLGRVKRAMRTLIPRFTARRMLADYVREMYAGG